MKKRLTQWIAVIGVLLALAGAAAQATGSARIVEINVMEEQLLAFVKDADSVSQVTAMVGKYASEEVSFQTLSESGLALKTLILVDNSLSIPQASRTATKDILLELIAARKGSEMFAVGTISEDVHILQDFTDDYTQLKSAIDELEYQNQETYLTDALYDYLSATPMGTAGGAFERILLLSDGVDNKSLGYTKDELIALLKGAPVPIYTVGVPNGKSGNDDELENMFAIARATGAESMLIKDLDSGVALASVLEADWEDLVVTASLPAEVLDGSLQTLTLTLTGSGGEASVSIDQVRMPLRAAEPPAEPEEKETPAVQPVIINEAPESNGGLLVVIAVLATVLLIGAITAVVLLVRAKKKKASFQALSAEREKNLRDMEMMESGSTYFLGADTEGGEEDGTLRCWDEGKVSTIVLTDIHAVEKCYQKPISKSLVIGLSKDSDICVNYDKSVSRTHCEILKEGDAYYLINHSQSNGTLLNGNRVVAKTPLFDGAIIKMGRVEMRVEIND